MLNPTGNGLRKTSSVDEHASPPGLAWRAARVTFEDCGKILTAGKSQFHGDVDDGAFCFVKQFGGLFNPAMREVGGWRKANFLLEFRLEPGQRKIGDVGQFNQWQRLFKILLNVVEHAADFRAVNQLLRLVSTGNDIEQEADQLVSQFGGPQWIPGVGMCFKDRVEGGLQRPRSTETSAGNLQEPL